MLSWNRLLLRSLHPVTEEINVIIRWTLKKRNDRIKPICSMLINLHFHHKKKYLDSMVYNFALISVIMLRLASGTCDP